MTKIEEIWIKILDYPVFIFEWEKTHQDFYERCKQEIMKSSGYKLTFIVEFNDKDRRITIWRRKPADIFSSI